MTVTPLAPVADARLEKMAKWCHEFAGTASLTGTTWMDAADKFFARFAPNNDEIVRQTGDWATVDLDDHTGRSERFQHRDMVFKFFERERGKFGVRLVGTVG